jgi:hypothetical protein
MKVAMDKAALIRQANQELQGLPCFEQGIEIVDAEMQGNVLVLRSSGPLNPDTDLSAINDFAKSFAEKYTLSSNG